jgi:hypothetical protein
MKTCQRELGATNMDIFLSFSHSRRFLDFFHVPGHVPPATRYCCVLQLYHYFRKLHSIFDHNTNLYSKSLNNNHHKCTLKCGGDFVIKKIILATMVLMLAISISLAAGPQGIHEPGTGLTDPNIKEAAQGTGQGLKTVNDTNASASTPGIHEPGTGIANPEMKQAAQGTGQGNQAQAAKQADAPVQKTQPGFEVIFALTSILVVALIVLRN